MRSKRYVAKADDLMEKSAMVVREVWPFLNAEVVRGLNGHPNKLHIHLPFRIDGTVDPIKSGLRWQLDYSMTAREYAGADKPMVLFGMFQQYRVGHVAVEVVYHSVIELMRLRGVALELGSLDAMNDLDEITGIGIKRLAKWSQTTRGQNAESQVALAAMRRSMELITINALAGTGRPL